LGHLSEVKHGRIISRMSLGGGVFGIVEMEVSKDDILVMEVEELCFRFLRGRLSDVCDVLDY